MNRTQSLQFSDEVPPIEEVTVGPYQPAWKNAVFQNAIQINAIHSGSHVPTEFEPKTHRAGIEAAYRNEKDWGADLIAGAVARHLGLPSYHRVNIARALMDFGRFPGVTTSNAGHMERYALSGSYARRLGRLRQRRVLERCYDPISDYIERRMWPAESSETACRQVIGVSVHTYDTYNPTPPYTERPHISFIHTTIGYNREKRMPFHVFDPIFPAHFGESTADPKLISRLALTMSTLKRERYPATLRATPGFRLRVGFNHPYELPDGSLEVRAQVWNFFRWLRADFEVSSSGRNTVHSPAYQLVWKMLLDTNLRDSETVALRSFIHMFRRGLDGVLPTSQTTFQDALAAYEHIERYASSDRVIDRFRHDPRRLSTLVIEVRKDLVWRHENGLPVDDESGALEENIDFIGQSLAQGLSAYIDNDALSNDSWDGVH